MDRKLENDDIVSRHELVVEELHNVVYVCVRVKKEVLAWTLIGRL